MNTTLRRAAKTITLFAGALFFWSSWAASPLRFALMNAHPMPPAKQVIKAQTDQQRFESAMRLGDALRDPKTISSADVKNARNTWGDEAARLLSLIR